MTATEEGATGVPKFIVDQNVGKLSRWLRMMGYDTRYFGGADDSSMVRQALAEGRTIVTKDGEIMKRRVVTIGRLRAILITSDVPEQQIRQVIETLNLNCYYQPFTLCLECNESLAERSIEEVKSRVPPYVFKTQEQYMECPACHRIYWRGTHWAAMMRRLKHFSENASHSEN